MDPKYVAWAAQQQQYYFQTFHVPPPPGWAPEHGLVPPSHYALPAVRAGSQIIMGEEYAQPQYTPSQLDVGGGGAHLDLDEDEDERRGDDDPHGAPVRHDSLGSDDVSDVKMVADLAELDDGTGRALEDAPVIEEHGGRGTLVHPVTRVVAPDGDAGSGSKPDLVSAHAPEAAVLAVGDSSASLHPPGPGPGPGPEPVPTPAPEKDDGCGSPPAPVRRRSTFGKVLAAGAMAMQAVGSSMRSRRGSGFASGSSGSTRGLTASASANSAAMAAGGAAAAAGAGAAAAQAAQAGEEPAKAEGETSATVGEPAAEGAAPPQAATPESEGHEERAAPAMDKVEEGHEQGDEEEEEREEEAAPAPAPAPAQQAPEPVPEPEPEPQPEPQPEAKKEEEPQKEETPAPAQQAPPPQPRPTPLQHPQAPATHVTINVRTLAGKVFTLEKLELNMTFFELRELITERVQNIPAEEQKLLFKGKVITNTPNATTLEEMGLKEGDFVHVVRQLAGMDKARAAAVAAADARTTVAATGHSPPHSPGLGRATTAGAVGLAAAGMGMGAAAAAGGLAGVAAMGAAAASPPHSPLPGLGAMGVVGMGAAAAGMGGAAGSAQRMTMAGVGGSAQRMTVAGAGPGPGPTDAPPVPVDASNMITVLTPPGRGPGDRLRIHPSGRGPMLVTVPPGVYEGMPFRVRLPDLDPRALQAQQAALAQQQAQLQAQAQARATTAAAGARGRKSQAPAPAPTASQKRTSQMQPRPTAAGNQAVRNSGRTSVAQQNQPDPAAAQQPRAGGQLMAVTVPPGYEPGMTMDVMVPGVGRMRLIVPMDCYPGSQFKFRLPA